MISRGLESPRLIVLLLEKERRHEYEANDQR
nr:MAG TPA: hypothetical protein [Caudoviricetes sp.]